MTDAPKNSGNGTDESVEEKIHPYIQQLMNEHQAAMQKIVQFEVVINEIREKGVDQDKAIIVNDFFQFFNNNLLVHNEREEKFLFPVLNQKILQNEGEELYREKPTAVELLQSDHVGAIQLGAVIFNLFGLAFRLPDPNSRLLTIDLATEQALELVDLLKLHIEREDNIVFPLAQKYIDEADLNKMG